MARRFDSCTRPHHRPRAPQSGPPDPPAPSTPVGPAVLGAAPRVGSLSGRSLRRPPAPWSGPVTAHRYCASKPARALRSLRRPPQRHCLVRINVACNSPETVSGFELYSLLFQRFWVLLMGWCNRITCEFSGERACSCARRGCLKPASPLLARSRVGLKPSSPLRAGDVGQLKPLSPLRVRNGCFSCVFWLQRCHRFQWLLLRGEQW